MKLYFDTSALIKKYISESGSDNVDKLLLSSTEIYISVIGRIEAISSFRRLLVEKEISIEDYKILSKELVKDFDYFNIIDISAEVTDSAIKTIDKYQLKSLDSIHLGSALSRNKEIDFFVSCDNKLLHAAKKEGFKVVNPRE
jgi:predicted nucleic acid-binding protein